MDDQTFLVNGVDGATGKLLPSLTRDQVAARARGGKLHPWILTSLTNWLKSLRTRGRGLAIGDATDLADSGWAVIFARDDPRAADIRLKLKALLDHRRAQAGRKYDIYYREISGELGYAPGESKQQFLSRLNVGPGAAQPQRLPYYLLLVGDPESIPYELQYQLDIEYAVGRIHFETLEEYARYAEGIVAAETAPIRPGPSRLGLFGPCHPDDPCSALSSQDLVEALGTSLSAHRPEVASAEKATKARLTALLGGEEAPDLLFTAGHGVLFGSGDRSQADRQGSLVCQDWPGPEGGPVMEEHAFAAADVSDEARVAGMMSFHFACFSAGWPGFDDFAGTPTASRMRLAPRAAVGKLPQRLLAHPNGGALAVIGHVERSYPCSITWAGAGRQIQHFESVLGEILAGKPVGYALENFGRRYAELSSDLCSHLENHKEGDDAYTDELIRLWTASHDARNYVLLGDPAVRLRPGAEAPDASPGAGSLPSLTPSF